MFSIIMPIVYEVTEYNTTYPNLFHYLADLRFKSHVQHAVSFIQHQIGATAQISLATLQEVNEAPWGSNANLNTFKKKRKRRNTILHI